MSGSLSDSGGQRFGFQLLVIRLALTPVPRARESAWATDQVYLAQFALADVTDSAFHAEERASREALGLSGSSQEPVRVWVEDWSLADAGAGTLGLSVAAQGRSLELVLRPSKRALTEGELNLPGLDVEAAFRLYAIPRLAATGELKRTGELLPVTGSAWLDHVWGDVPVPTGQVAIDRFILQLDDGRDILCLRLHRRDGSGTPIPSCLLVAADGSTRVYRRRDIGLEQIGEWKGASHADPYPVRWQLAIPGLGLELSIAPLVERQELDVPIPAWRGAVTVDGLERGDPVAGVGFLELTGYAQSP